MPPKLQDGKMLDLFYSIPKYVAIKINDPIIFLNPFWI
jgi:hypothetical protein